MNRNKQIFWGVFFAGLAVILLIGLMKFSNILAFLMILPWLANQLVEKSGMNIWLARAIATIPTILFLVGLSMSMSYFPTFQKKFPFLRFQKIKRIWGYALLTTLFIGYSITMFAMDDAQLFDPKTGHAKKCLALGTTDYEEINCDWDFHPVTGNPVIKDRAQVKAIFTAKQTSPHDPGPSKKIINNGQLRFFDSAGNPLVWYYEYEDGRIELFDQPGKHPQWNTDLIAINPAIVKKLLNYRDSPQPGNKIIFNQTNNANPLIELRDYLLKLHQ